MRAPEGQRTWSQVPLAWQITFFAALGIVLLIMTVVRLVDGHSDIWILGAILGLACLSRAWALRRPRA